MITEEMRSVRQTEVEKINLHARDMWEKAYEEDAHKLPLDEIEKVCDLSLSEEQQAEVDRVWKRYEFAYKNDSRVQALSTRMSGEFSPWYISEGLAVFYLWRHYDAPTYHEAFQNKNYRELLFGEENCSKAIIRRIKGVYFSGDREQITYTRALNLVVSELKAHGKDLILKPTPGGRGVGIQFILKTDTVNEIAEKMLAVTEDLLVERLIEQHETIAAMNPDSVNTLRIITYIYDGECRVLATVLRIGGAGNRVDNFSQGGVAVGLKDDGSCFNFGFDHFGNRHDRTPNGIVFEGTVIPGVREANELCRKMHLRVPQFKKLGWDIAIDKDGHPVIIEMNPRAAVTTYQGAGVLPFGDVTEQVLDTYLRFLYHEKHAVTEWNYDEYHDHVILTKYAFDEPEITVPEEINGKPVTGIAAGCFTGSALKKLVIPGCVKALNSGYVMNPDAVEIIHLPDERGIIVETPSHVRVSRYENGIKLEWDCVEGASDYRIFRMQQGGERRIIRTLVGSEDHYYDRELVSEEMYFYWIKAHDTATDIFSDFSERVFINAPIA